MNIVEKGLLIIIVIAMAFFMLPVILGQIFSSLSGDVLLIIIFAFIIGIVAVPILIIRHKES